MRHHPDPSRCRRRDHSAFSIIELMIVVVILGILALVVIPKFSNAGDQARDATLLEELRYLRNQIAVYRAQHHEMPPGNNGTFVEQMTSCTDVDGNVGPSGVSHPLGPYLSSMPTNPVNDKDTVKTSTAANLTTAIDDTTGWLYNPNTGEIIANSSGADLDGVSYSDY